MNVTAMSDAGSNRSELAATGGLVVLNGRLKGARRPLTGPMTLIGQAQGCEVRLNVQGVKPYHCAIIQSVEGYLLRDLAGEETTFLNGKAVLQQVLRSGDRIEVGPFQFQIDCPDSLQAENVRKVSQALRAERDALRIQAAAMAAQYAGLTEEEIRLEQRRLALQRQEEQLAGRLEERHRELREQEENLRREQDAFTASGRPSNSANGGPARSWPTCARNWKRTIRRCWFNRNAIWRCAAD